MTMAQQREGKRLGRPLKAPTPGKRVALGLKVTAEIKQRIDEQARKSGRTQSQQAELMVERAFTDEDRFGGPAMRPIVEMLVGAFLRGGQFGAAASGHADWTPAEWLNDPHCYRAAAYSVGFALNLPLPTEAPMDDPARLHELLTGMIARGMPITRTEGARNERRPYPRPR
jgi:hypothetical protein